MKFIFGELKPDEMGLLFDHPAALSDPLFLVVAKAKIGTSDGFERMLFRLEKITKILGIDNPYRRSLLKQWEGNFVIVAKERTFPIRPPKKFSGYVRNSSSVGSKRRTGIANFDPIFERFSSESFDMYNFIFESITVGEVVPRTGVMRVTLNESL